MRLTLTGGTNGGTEKGLVMPTLTVKTVAAAKVPGMISDGAGLYLRVGPTLSKSWILRTVVHGKRRELGLGSVSLVSLAEARDLARAYRKIAREGGDPDTERKRESLTFLAAAAKVHAKLLPNWKNAKHAETWLNSIETHAGPVFGNRPIHTVGTADVLKSLEPIWTTTPETAKRLRQRIATVFDWAKGAGHYPHENPVNGIIRALPSQKVSQAHHDALPWRDVVEFMAALKKRAGESARCLEFIILTAARSGEARGARWDEVDLGKKVWTVPAERMKRGLVHRVPLSDAVMEVLQQVRGLDRDLLFPSPQRHKEGTAKPQSDMAFKALMKRMDRDGFTTHGFRSTFRDWASESARVEREVAEAALAHATGTAVERAYARSDLFDRRHELMELWGQYVNGQIG
jgi:integrase